MVHWGEHDFTHLTVNHSLYFVDPSTGAHTNTIESTWRALKASLPKCGTQKHLYTSYFFEYALRKSFLKSADDKFLTFLDLVSKVYSADALASPNLPAIPSNLPQLELLPETSQTQLNHSFDMFPEMGAM